MANAGLDAKTIEIVKSTVPVLEQHGNAITKRFYEMMLSEVPELNNIFNQTNQKRGGQPKALAATVYAAAANIDQLENILPVVKQISEKHKSLDIKAEHYPIVGKYLLKAIKDVLGDAATDEIIDAWAKAYGVIADVFISVEKGMYEEDAASEGGWNGFRDFKIVRKTKESDVVTSFYLAPVDGKSIMKHKPGQYITVKATIPGQKYVHMRQYSLSDAPGSDMYRISVKREDAKGDYSDGIVSTYMHETVQEGDILPISAPSGDFIVDTKDARPLVLISRGVGLTPVMSMLEEVTRKQPEREIYFIYATYSSNMHPMKERMEQIATENKNVHMTFVYNKPLVEDEGKYDYKGYVDEALLNKLLPTTDVACYFCGFEDFMRTVSDSLKAMGVKEEDRHFEYFGPQLGMSIA
ncbi:NO-inducible flavohemoprotein [Aciduricibacillus chroicocephali]|uniref:Flavohemoprotein n=1 Tax=Aciduricibacillus chroicocephali TaxID=3054939 RepID=A0ABY9KWM3_9BACI|nr:NO-inducible flavohemoprotein [Bacillaceae bacterium 44XB]